MIASLLSVKDLHTWFGTGDSAARAVDGVSFDIKRGETLALLGESGCGKSVTALSIMGLVPAPAGHIVSGIISYEDSDLLGLSEVQMRGYRGKRIAMIFQEPMTSLNPVLTVGRQIGEVLAQHLGIKGKAAVERTKQLLDAVGIPDPGHRLHEYPHQLSGGMKQRIVIAIALAAEPDLLIADEPTTALDVTIQAQILELLAKLQKEKDMAMLLITHDLGVVSDFADRVAVMYAGQIIEEADKETFFANPAHPYSRKLFDSVPGSHKRGRPLAVIHGNVPSLRQVFSGCRFVERCDMATDICRNNIPGRTNITEAHYVVCHHPEKQIGEENDHVKQSLEKSKIQPASKGTDIELLKVDNLKVHFPIHKGILRRTRGQVKAVDGVSLKINRGQTVALVGESGCGKTTVGKGILQLIKPTAGKVDFDGEDISRLDSSAMRRRRSDMQIIFQDPYSSMNPRLQVGGIIEEGMVAQRKELSSAERSSIVERLLEMVGLPAEAKTRYPHEFSGGQRQRICVARALAVDPELIICDEPTSALDVSVQAQILNLLQELQRKMGLSYLLITHNMSVVDYLADEVAVMYLGRIVEYGTTREVMDNPSHPYTRALLSAVPVIDKESRREFIRLEGEMPSPVNPPDGCHFHPRCPQAMPQCSQGYPEEAAITASHTTHCFLYD